MAELISMSLTERERLLYVKYCIGVHCVGHVIRVMSP
jgi:hypothetical protein